MLIIGDSKSNESFVGYDCDICIAKEMMGKRIGRVCLKYQVDFDEDKLIDSFSHKIFILII